VRFEEKNVERSYVITAYCVRSVISASALLSNLNQ